MMHRHKPKSLRLCGLIGLLLSAGASSMARPPGHIARHGQDALQRQQEVIRHTLRNLHGHINSVQSKIHTSRSQEINLGETIQTVEARMTRTRAKLNESDNRLEALGDQDAKVEARLMRTEDHLMQRKRVLAQRLRDNYQRRQATYLQALLRSRTVHEVLSRSYYVRLIVQSDAELIESIQKDLAQTQADRRLLERQQNEQQALSTDLENQKTQYEADLSRQRILLHGVKTVRIEAEQELDDLESEADAMNGKIRALSEMLRRQQEAARRAALEAARLAARLAAQHAARHPGKHSGRAVKSIARHSESLPVVWHGVFVRPCAGPLTSGFGMRFHPILHRYRMHAGVDFGAGTGAPIRAAAAGIVLLSAYSRGYGNCVIIDHGGGVTTLYGHCSARLVQAGESVKQGQLVARVGATGLATGPHLHFEVRHDGNPVPPF